MLGVIRCSPEKKENLENEILYGVASRQKDPAAPSSTRS